MNIKSFIRILQLAVYTDKIIICDDKNGEIAYQSYIDIPIPDSYGDVEILYTWVGIEGIYLAINLN